MIGQSGSLPLVNKIKDPNCNDKVVKKNTPEASMRARENWDILRRNMHVISGANTRIDFTHLGKTTTIMSHYAASIEEIV